MIRLERVLHAEQRAQSGTRDESHLRDRGWSVGSDRPGTPLTEWSDVDLMNQPVAGERGSDAKKKPAPVRLSWRELDGLPVRSGPVGFGPGFPAREQRSLVGQTLGRHHALESRQPVFVVARAVVGFPAPGSGLQFLGETGSPLFPGEVPLL